MAKLFRLSYSVRIRESIAVIKVFAEPKNTIERSVIYSRS